MAHTAKTRDMLMSITNLLVYWFYSQAMATLFKHFAFLVLFLIFSRIRSLKETAVFREISKYAGPQVKLVKRCPCTHHARAAVATWGTVTSGGTFAYLK